MINEQQMRHHRWHNRLQAVLMVLGMSALMGLCAELLLGEGAFWWMLAIIGLSLLFSPQLPPALIMRLYRARPLASEEVPNLLGLLHELSHRAGLEQPPVLYYLPSSALNAFTVGHRGDAAIAITDGLLRGLKWPEMAGVLAHEVSHIVHNDIRVMGLADLINRLTNSLAFFGMILVFVNLPFMLLGEFTISWLGILLLVFSPHLTALMLAALSRTREFHADLAAVEITGNPQALASALQKIAAPQERWFNRILQPSGTEVIPSLLRSHPPTRERIERLISLAHQPQTVFRSPQYDDHLHLPNIDVIRHQPRRHWHGFWY